MKNVTLWFPDEVADQMTEMADRYGLSLEAMLTATCTHQARVFARYRDCPGEWERDIAHRRWLSIVEAGREMDRHGTVLAMQSVE